MKLSTIRKQEKEKTQLKAKKNIPHAVVDLFSGAGGLSLGACRAGFSLRGGVEIDSEALKVHQKNFPNSPHLNQDVAKLSGQSLLASLKLKKSELSGIIGGPPCQGFSCIGKNDHEDPRNHLFIHFFRIVSEALPKFFLAENVPGILNEKYSKIRHRALSFVENKYKLLPPIKISANDYGVPTTRTRVFFFGYLPSELESLTPDSFAPSSSVRAVYVRDALSGLPTKINPKWQSEDTGWRIVQNYDSDYYSSRLGGYVPPSVGDPIVLKRLRKEKRVSGCLGTFHSAEVVRRFAKVEQGSKDKISKCPRLDPNRFCPTLRAGTGSDRGSFQAVRPIHPIEDRVITPREAARLQGFPDWFIFSPSKWHSFRQIGSSVSPILAEHILRVIMIALGGKSESVA